MNVQEKAQYVEWYIETKFRYFSAKKIVEHAIVDSLHQGTPSQHGTVSLCSLEALLNT